MYCRTYDIGVKGIAPEGREMIMPGEDATMTLYISKRMVCISGSLLRRNETDDEIFRLWKKVLDLLYVMPITKPWERVLSPMYIPIHHQKN